MCAVALSDMDVYVTINVNRSFLITSAPCGESMLHLAGWEKSYLSTLSFTSESFPQITCIWLVKGVAGFGIVTDVTYIDLRYQYLIVGVGDYPRDENNTQHRYTGGTVPLPAVYNETDIWILLDASLWINRFDQGGFEMDIFNYNHLGTPILNTISCV